MLTIIKNKIKKNNKNLYKQKISPRVYFFYFFLIWCSGGVIFFFIKSLIEKILIIKFKTKFHQ